MNKNINEKYQNVNEKYQNVIEKSIVQIFNQKIEIDLNHPLNIYKNIQTSGTGFIIDKNEILTCYHVVENALNIKIILNNIEKKATIKYIFPDDDLAILSFDNDFKDYNILNYDIITNKGVSEVTTVGFPYNSKNIIITKGIISGYQDSLIQTDSPLNSGNSGGPILIGNDFIGINQKKMTGDASNIGFAIPVFRFLIFWKLNKDKLKKVNNKPILLFKYQKIKQKEFIKSDGVIITKLHEKSPLKLIGVEIGDFLLSINNSIIDNDGFVKFDFFPEKISINDLHLWFIEGDKIKVQFYSNKYKKVETKDLIFKNVITNLPNFYYGLTDPYYYENNGLIISIFTNFHLENFKDLELNVIQRLKIFERINHYNDKFTIYLADINYTKLKFNDYPVGDIIIEINDISIDDIETFKNVISKPLKKIKTINNEVFFI